MSNVYLEITQLQKAANDIAKPDWVNDPPPYLRAAMMETVECIDHINSWKWWKGNKPDFENAAMEMVDVLHFVISQELVDKNSDIEAVSQLIGANLENFDKGPTAEAERDYVRINDELEQLAGSFIARETDYALFMGAVNFCGLSAQTLCLWYLGKNALNNFRQANGYKQGTYHKAWFGGEDNDTLIDIINNKVGSRDTDQSVYDFITAQLGEQYQLALAERDK
jgi:dimeric dUTPase (all-alpha-NTP-PPase superfamily)